MVELPFFLNAASRLRFRRGAGIASHIDTMICYAGRRQAIHPERKRSLHLSWTIDDLDTPCITIDLDAVERNLARAQDYCRRNGLALRPHIKTHKIPELARRQVEVGAVGITCQKIGEAEIMADAGIEDILITYNIVGRQKLERLAALARRTQLTIVFDSRRPPKAFRRRWRRRASALARWSSATPAPAVAASSRLTRPPSWRPRSRGCRASSSAD